jgi:hypothetical protein
VRCQVRWTFNAADVGADWHETLDGFDADGTPTFSISPVPSGHIRDMVATSDGRVIASVVSDAGLLVPRLVKFGESPAERTWEVTLELDGCGSFGEVVERPNGDLVGLGATSDPCGSASGAWLVAGFNPDGQPSWHAPVSDLAGFVINSMAAAGDGDIIVTGDAREADIADSHGGLDAVLLRIDPEQLPTEMPT